LGTPEASALGGDTPSPYGKVKYMTGKKTGEKETNAFHKEI